MSDNFLKIYNGVSYVPRSADPANPLEGDVQFADGTVRSKGLWQYHDSSWNEVSGGGGGTDFNPKFAKLHGVIVGSAADVTAGYADYSVIQTAITAASAGDMITILSGTFTETLTISKKLHIVGQGNDTVLDGTVALDAAAAKSSLKYLKFNDNITGAVSCDRLIITDCWIAATKTIDLDDPTENIVLVMEE